MANIDDVYSALVKLDISGIADITKATIEDGSTAIEILNHGLLPAMKIVGEKFREGEIFLPELILSGRAMEKAMEVLRPTFEAKDSPQKGKIAIGTVKGDIHDIGKNLVIMMLEGNGWEVFDLGVDVSAEDFCSFMNENDVDILGMSALLTTTAPELKVVINALVETGLRNKAKIIVGGALVTQSICDSYGADGYAKDAVEAVELANRLMLD